MEISEFFLKKFFLPKTQQKNFYFSSFIISLVLDKASEMWPQCENLFFLKSDIEK